MTIDSPVFFPKRGSVNKKGPPAGGGGGGGQTLPKMAKNGYVNFSLHLYTEKKIAPQNSKKAIFLNTLCLCVCVWGGGGGGFAEN